MAYLGRHVVFFALASEIGVMDLSLGPRDRVQPVPGDLGLRRI